MPGQSAFLHSHSITTIGNVWVPSNTSRRTLARQWELLRLLPSKSPGLTAAELHIRLQDAGHETSKRTIERDLLELSQLFPLQCNDKGMPYGWHWMPGCASELPGLSLGEALTLKLVEDSLHALIPHHMLKTLEPRFRQAHQKLHSLSDEVPAARWIQKVASVHPELSLLPPIVDEDILETVQEALLHEKQLDCVYYAAHKNQVHQFTLNPLSLVQRGQVTYLLATAEPFDDVRQFALHRFSSARLLDSAATEPTDFNLQKYLSSGAMQFGTPVQIKIEAWINDGLARLLRETPLSQDMTLTSKGEGALLKATVTDSWELRWWVLSHAGSIQIHKPKQLAKEITDRLKDGLELQSQKSQAGE